MWAMAQNSIVLFFRGKLFADPGKAMTAVADRRPRHGRDCSSYLPKLERRLWLAALVGGADWRRHCSPILFRRTFDIA